MIGLARAAGLISLALSSQIAAGAPIADLTKLRSGQGVKVGGLLVVVQRPPSAKIFAFLGVEVASGIVNVIVTTRAPGSKKRRPFDGRRQSEHVVSINDRNHCFSSRISARTS